MQLIGCCSIFRSVPGWVQGQGVVSQQLPGPPPLGPAATDSRALADAFLDSLGAEDNGPPAQGGITSGTVDHNLQSISAGKSLSPA